MLEDNNYNIFSIFLKTFLLLRTISHVFFFADCISKKFYYLLSTQNDPQGEYTVFKFQMKYYFSSSAMTLNVKQGHICIFCIRCLFIPQQKSHCFKPYFTEPYTVLHSIDTAPSASCHKRKPFLIDTEHICYACASAHFNVLRGPSRQNGSKCRIFL